MRIACAALSLVLVAGSAAAETAYPAIPEPMVFDMMRPLGAKKGEMEANVLALTQAPFRPTRAEWAPEVEYAFADGKAVEFELPFDGARLAAFKLGLQTAFGVSADGKSAHGAQYLGIYDREAGRYTSSLLYMAGKRFSERFSIMNMIGLDDIVLKRRGGGGSGARGHNALLLNHASFYDLRIGTVLGAELNVAGGGRGHVRLTPQVHQRLAERVNVQFGAGLEKARRGAARPVAGVRLVREF